MKLNVLIYIVISIVLSLVSYLASGSIFVFIIVFVTSLLYFFLLFYRRFNSYQKKIKRFQSCYQFINNFIISLSVRSTITGALESVKNMMDKGFNEELEGINHLDDEEKLNYLKKYYDFHIYQLFLNVIQIFQERGGNLLSLSSHLLDESRNQIEYVNQCERMGKRKGFEFAILWFFTLLILVLVRFALSSFFSALSSQLSFQIMVVVVFLFILFSIEMLAHRAFTIDIKGWEQNG